MEEAANVLRDNIQQWLEKKDVLAQAKIQLKEQQLALKPLQETVQGLQKEVKQLEAIIIEDMKEHDIPHCDLVSSRKGTLTVTKNVVRRAPTKQHYEKGIAEFLEDYHVEATVGDVMYYIQSKQGITEKEEIKLV